MATEEEESDGMQPMTGTATHNNNNQEEEEEKKFLFYSNVPLFSNHQQKRRAVVGTIAITVLPRCFIITFSSAISARASAPTTRASISAN